jgi:phosphatidylserine decarboxylase precursor
MKKREKITQRFIELMKNTETRSLMEEALYKASLQNPDRETNPAFTLEEFYDVIDWGVRCMPWNLLQSRRFTTLSSQIDQSINYFWFVFGQPLDALKDKDYYLPNLEYHEPIASWLKEFSDDWGAFLSSEESWNDEYFRLQFEDDNFGMNKGWYPSENIYHSYNEFFSRHLIDPSVRPIGDAEVVAPADSRPEGVWKIKEDGYLDMTGLIIKSHRFATVDELLGKYSSYHGKFNGGTLTHTFLNVNDYHRYHFPISGKILEMSKIKAFNAVGGHTSFVKELNRYVCDCSDTSWQARETRDCVILDTDYGLVACLPIGMSQICSCNYEENLKVGDEVRKGDPLGYFLFGGSDFVMVFQKDVEFEMLAKVKEHILMGENYARLKLK